MRRDHPDSDHAKLLEDIVDQPATAATAVRKSHAGRMTFQPTDTTTGFVS